MLFSSLTCQRHRGAMSACSARRYWMMAIACSPSFSIIDVAYLPSAVTLGKVLSALSLQRPRKHTVNTASTGQHQPPSGQG